MILKINKKYFENLSKGTHTLKVNFKDGFASGTFEVSDKISFTILDTTFTATKGMTWSDWIISYGQGHSGNNIIWVNHSNELFLDCRDNASWSQGAPLGSEEDALYDSNDVRQTLATIIVNGAVYGRSSDAPN